MQAVHEPRYRRALTVLSAVALLCLPVSTRPDLAAREASPEPLRAVASSASPSWEAEAERTISEREYEATESGTGLQAPNRAHGLRARFDASGVRVEDREDARRELARLRTVAIGRGRRGRQLGEGDVQAKGSRVEILRAGLVEWYENTERGLEQGWTLSERPEGDGSLALEVELAAGSVSVVGDWNGK